MNELLELNRNIGHWLFEIEGGVIAAILGAIWHTFWQRKHDSTVHNVTTESLVSEFEGFPLLQGLIENGRELPDARVYCLDNYRRN